MEAFPDGSRILCALVAVLSRARHDAESDRFQARAMAHRALRRQAAGATERHFAHPRPDTLQESATIRREASQTGEKEKGGVWGWMTGKKVRRGTLLKIFRRRAHCKPRNR